MMRRYWKITDAADEFSPEFVEGVNKIIWQAETDGIRLCHVPGVGKPNISVNAVKLNGKKDLGEKGEAFVLTPMTEHWSHEGQCDTQEQPYDAVVDAILRYAKISGYVTDLEADEAFDEAEAVRLLHAATESEPPHVTIRGVLNFSMDVAENLRMARAIREDAENMAENDGIGGFAIQAADETAWTPLEYRVSDELARWTKDGKFRSNGNHEFSEIIESLASCADVFLMEDGLDGVRFRKAKAKTSRSHVITGKSREKLKKTIESELRKAETEK